MTSSCTPRHRAASRATHGTPTPLPKHHPSKHFNPRLTSSPPHLQRNPRRDDIICTPWKANPRRDDDSLANEKSKHTPPNHDRGQPSTCLRTQPMRHAPQQLPLPPTKSTAITQKSPKSNANPTYTSMPNRNARIPRLHPKTPHPNLHPPGRKAAKASTSRTRGDARRASNRLVRGGESS
jgi:hypothetical protein